MATINLDTIMNIRDHRKSPNKIKQLETLNLISRKLRELQTPENTGHEVIAVVEDLMLMEAVANQVPIAIHNSQPNQQIHQNVDEPEQRV
jgi:hypothetical protein